MTVAEAEELIKIVEIERPEVYRLARAVSLAARIEPELVRAVRLNLFRDVDAGAEADLWFSPLVQAQSHLAMLFFPAVADGLRQRLAEDQDLLALTWDLLNNFHRQLPPVLRLEEELTWLALTANGPQELIEERLISVLTAMKNEKRHGLARWATRALPTLPEKVRTTETAHILSVVAGVQTGAGPVLNAVPRTGSVKKWLHQITAKNLGRVAIGVRLLRNNPSRPGGEGHESFTGGPGRSNLLDTRPRERTVILELSYPPAPSSNEIEVPDTNVVLLEVSWREGENRRVRHVTLRQDEVQRAEIVFNKVRIRSALGDIHNLQQHFDYDFFLTYNREDEIWVRDLMRQLEQQERRGEPLKLLSLPLRPDPFKEITLAPEEAICTSKKVGFVVSPHSVGEDWRALESMASGRVEPVQSQEWLIPLYVSSAQVPAALADKKLIDFRMSRNFEESLGALWKAITGEPLPSRRAVTLPTFRITMLGDSGAGKTAFMSAMYAMLREGRHGVALRAIQNDVDLELSHNIENLYAYNMWPSATDSNTKRYEFELLLNSKSIAKIDWVDYRGGALFLSENEEAGFSLLGRLRESHSILWMIDMSHIKDKAIDSSAARLTTRVGRMAHLCRQAAANSNNLRSIIFVRTKSDEVLDADGKPDWHLAAEQLLTHLGSGRPVDVPYSAAVPVSAVGRMTNDHQLLGDDPYNVEWPLLLAVAFMLEDELRKLSRTYEDTRQVLTEARPGRVVEFFKEILSLGISDKHVAAMQEADAISRQLIGLKETIGQLIKECPSPIKLLTNS